MEIEKNKENARFKNQNSIFIAILGIYTKTRENFIDGNGHIIKNRTVKLRVIVKEWEIAGIVKGLLIWNLNILILSKKIGARKTSMRGTEDKSFLRFDNRLF